MKSELTNIIKTHAGSSPILKIYGGTDLIWTSGPPRILNIDFSDPTSYPGTGTTVTDISSVGGTGTFYGDTTYVSRSDGATFDGNNDYIRFARTDINGGTFAYDTISVNMWIKKDSTIDTKDNIFTIENTLEIAYNGTGISYASNPWSWRNSASGVITMGQWHMITYVHTLTDRYLYVDGVQVYTSPDNGALAAGSGTYPYLTLMGRFNGVQYNVDGNLGSVEMYDGILSQDNITALYNSTKNKFTNDLILHLDAADPASYPGTGTTWFDLSSYGNNASLASVTKVTDMGGSMYFDGTGWATVPFDASMDFDAEQTIIICLKPLESDTNRRNPYNQAYGGGGTMTHETDGTINYYAGTNGGNGTPYSSLNSSVTVVENESTIMAITRNSSNFKWYKNGVEVSSKAGQTVTTGTSDILIGNGYTNSYLGNIAFVKVYKRALSAQEITNEYNAYQNRLGDSSLIVHYDATNASSYPGSGNTWYDISGNNHHGTIDSGTSFESVTGGSFKFTDNTNSKITFTSPAMAIGLGDFTLELFLLYTGNEGDPLYGGAFSSGSVSGDFGIIAALDKCFVGHSSSSETLDYNYSQGGFAWKQFIFLRRGNDMEAWRDGTFVGSTTLGSPDSINNTVGVIGQRYTNNFNYGFGGHIGIVRLYNRALSSTEINDNYVQDIGKFSGSRPGTFTLSIDAYDTDSVDLSWTNSSGADNYTLYENGSAVINNTTATSAIRSVNSGTQYTYYVRANNNYAYLDSDTKIVTTDSNPTPNATPAWATSEIATHKTRVQNDGGVIIDEPWLGHDLSFIDQTFWNNNNVNVFSAAGGWKNSVGKWYGLSNDQAGYNDEPDWGGVGIVSTTANGRPVFSLTKSETFAIYLNFSKNNHLTFFEINWDTVANNRLTLSCGDSEIGSAADFIIEFDGVSQMVFYSKNYSPVTVSGLSSSDYNNCKIGIHVTSSTTYEIFMNGVSRGTGTKHSEYWYRMCSPSYYIPGDVTNKFSGDLVQHYVLLEETLTNAQIIAITSR